MADAYRVKVKVGQFEFEAEGEKDVVDRQYNQFLDHLPKSGTPVTPPDVPSEHPLATNGEPAKQGELNLDAIFKTEGRVVSLTVNPESEEETALLILLGQKHYRTNPSVTASELQDGLEESGVKRRGSELIAGFGDKNWVLKSGERKGTRYRLTNPGLSAAREIAKKTIELVE
jgi:hypothetical protein